MHKEQLFRLQVNPQQKQRSPEDNGRASLNSSKREKNPVNSEFYIQKNYPSEISMKKRHFQVNER